MKLYLDYNLTNGDNNLCYVFLHGWGMKKEYFDKIISQLDVNGQILSLDFLGLEIPLSLKNILIRMSMLIIFI